MSKGGRPCHDYWEKGQFERQTRNSKTVAACSVCDKVLLNTSQSRLQQHRNVCPRNHDEKASTSITIKNNKTKQEINAISSSISNGLVINGTAVNSTTDNIQYIVLPVHSNIQSIENETIGNIINQLPNKKRKSDQSNITKWIDTMSDEEQKEADRLLVKFFYTSDISLKSIQSKDFAEFMKVLRPSYKIPNEDETYEILDEIIG